MLKSTTAGELLSPITSQPMRAFSFKGVELDYCDESHFIWLDRGELEKITRVDTSKLSRLDGSSSWLEGIDLAITGGDVFDFVFAAVGSIFD